MIECLARQQRPTAHHANPQTYHHDNTATIKPEAVPSLSGSPRPFAGLAWLIIFPLVVLVFFSRLFFIQIKDAEDIELMGATSDNGSGTASVVTFVSSYLDRDVHATVETSPKIKEIHAQAEKFDPRVEGRYGG